MSDHYTIDPSELDTDILREIKRFVEANPVFSAETPLTNDYRAGKRDAYSNVAAKLSEWIDES